MAAFVLSKGRFKYKKIIFTIIVSTLLFSADVLGIPNFVVVSQLRLINTYFAIILPAIAVPLGAFLMKQFMETNIPDTLIESARIDGATVWAIFWKLVMPLVKPAWLTLIIFSFQQIWTREGLQFIYNESLKVLPTMFRQIIAAGVGRSDLAAAATVLIIIPPIIAFVIAQSRVLETMANSGIK
jgi:ABC-type glycerol-3-phosphate transport system permease component